MAYTCEHSVSDRSGEWFHCRVENFCAVQFSRMGNLQRFCDSIFVDGHSRAAQPTLPVGSTSYCMQPKTCEMARELHTIEAIVCVYHVYNKIWCAAEVIDHLLRGQLIDQTITMAMPPANRA